MAKIKRIRMVRDLVGTTACYEQGRVYRVPQEITEAVAESWLKAGIAIEDKMIDGPPETKMAKK